MVLQSATDAIDNRPARRYLAAADRTRNSMSSIEFTKMAMAAFIAGIVALSAGMIASALVSPTMLEENVFVVDLGDDAAPAVDDAVEEAPSIDVLLASADAGSGEGLSRACAACHSFDKGGASGIGPNLWDIVNRPLAATDGYSYSSALSDKGGEWSYEALDGFIAAPRDWASGTKMSYAGMRSAEDRADLIAWLASLSDGGAPEFAPPPEAETAVEPEAEAEAAQEAEAEAAPEAAADSAAAEESMTEVAAAGSQLGALMAAADADAGERLSRACAACHSFNNGGGSRIGPNLWDIVNRSLASVDGYSYSSALSDKGGAWSYEALDGYIAAPRDWAPGTKMSFAGMRSPEDRANLIAWLRSLSDSPAALPE